MREELAGTGLTLLNPFDAGEHWSEQAKPKGAAKDGGAFTREAGKPRV